MPLLDVIEADMKEALRASEKLRLETLRMLKSGLKYKQIELGAPLKDEDVIAYLNMSIKQHKDSIEQFRKGGREDLAHKEEEELRILRSYMPKQLSPEELDALIAESIRETGASGARDMGKVIKAVMAKAKGAAEGKTVSEKVKEALARPGL